MERKRRRIMTRHSLSLRKDTVSFSIDNEGKDVYYLRREEGEFKSEIENAEEPTDILKLRNKRKKLMVERETAAETCEVGTSISFISNNEGMDDGVEAFAEEAIQMARREEELEIEKSGKKATSMPFLKALRRHFILNHKEGSLDGLFSSKSTIDTLKGVKPSLIINLYPTGFSFDKNQHNLYSYDASPFNDLLRALDERRLSPDLLGIVNSKPCYFYDGCLIVEIRDYRRSVLINPKPSNGSALSHKVVRVVLRPDHDCIITDVTELAAERNLSTEDMLLLESKILEAVQPAICLDTSPLVSFVSNWINSNRQKFNFRSSKKCRRLVPYMLDADALSSHITTYYQSQQRTGLGRRTPRSARKAKQELSHGDGRGRWKRHETNDGGDDRYQDRDRERNVKETLMLMQRRNVKVKDLKGDVIKFLAKKNLLDPVSRSCQGRGLIPNEMIVNHRSSHGGGRHISPHVSHSRVIKGTLLPSFVVKLATESESASGGSSKENVRYPTKIEVFSEASGTALSISMDYNKLTGNLVLEKIADTSVLHYSIPIVLKSVAFCRSLHAAMVKQSSLEGYVEGTFSPRSIVEARLEKQGDLFAQRPRERAQGEQSRTRIHEQQQVAPQIQSLPQSKVQSRAKEDILDVESNSQLANRRHGFQEGASQKPVPVTVGEDEEEQQHQRSAENYPPLRKWQGQGKQTPNLSVSASSSSSQQSTQQNAQQSAKKNARQQNAQQQNAKQLNAQQQNTQQQNTQQQNTQQQFLADFPQAQVSASQSQANFQGWNNSQTSENGDFRPQQHMVGVIPNLHTGYPLGQSFYPMKSQQFQGLPMNAQMHVQQPMRKGSANPSLAVTSSNQTGPPFFPMQRTYGTYQRFGVGAVDQDSGEASTHQANSPKWTQKGQQLNQTGQSQSQKKSKQSQQQMQGQQTKAPQKRNQQFHISPREYINYPGQSSIQRGQGQYGQGVYSLGALAAKQRLAYGPPGTGAQAHTQQQGSPQLAPSQPFFQTANTYPHLPYGYAQRGYKQQISPLGSPTSGYFAPQQQYSQRIGYIPPAHGQLQGQNQNQSGRKNEN